MSRIRVPKAVLGGGAIRPGGSGGIFGGGGGSASVIMPITVIGEPTASAITISRANPSVGALDTWDLEYKLSTDSTWTTVTGLTAGTHEVTGLTPERTYDFRATGHVMVDSVLATTTATTEASTAPTVPVPRQIWTAGWGLTNQTPLGLIPEGQRRVFRGTIRNISGFSTTSIALDLVQGQGQSVVYDVAVGPRAGETFDASSWQTAKITVPAAANGAVAPGYKRVVFALNFTWANDAEIVLSVRPQDNYCITSRFLNANSWTYSAMGSSAISSSDIGLTDAWVSGSLSVWASVCGISLLNLATDPCIQIAHVGDSVGEGVTPLSDENSLSREGWYFQANATEVSNGRRFHWSSVANGTYTLDAYLERILHLIDTEWVDTIDVVSLQCWTHNQPPSDVATAQAYWALLEGAANAIRAKSRGVIFTMLTPPSYTNQSADAIAAWQWLKTRIASEAHVYLDDIVADGTGTAISSAASDDFVHIFLASQALQGQALPARTVPALHALGYTV